MKAAEGPELLTSIKPVMIKLNTTEGLSSGNLPQ